MSTAFNIFSGDNCNNDDSYDSNSDDSDNYIDDNDNDNDIDDSDNDIDDNYNDVSDDDGSDSDNDDNDCDTLLRLFMKSTYQHINIDDCTWILKVTRSMDMTAV